MTLPGPLVGRIAEKVKGSFVRKVGPSDSVAPTRACPTSLGSRICRLCPVLGLSLDVCAGLNKKDHAED
jgi:hypothetical protein